MKILVTGGAGFIGSHLCRRLLQEGNEVVCADDLFTGSRENIADLLGQKGFTFLLHDVTCPLELPGVEQIYNLACPASPVHYQHDPVKTLETSFLGARNMLALARAENACILQASTSEVYGDPAEHPQRESYWGNVNPIGVRSCYDEGKRAAETLFFDCHRKYGTRIKVVRIFNTYGPNMQRDDGRVISNFIVQALEGKDITVYGQGGQTRSFCYVSDLVDGLCRMMNSAPDFIGPVNLGNPGEYSIRELAEKIVALTGSSSRLVTCPLPADDPQKRRPDISLAGRALDWRPTVPLEEGLMRTIAYFKKRFPPRERMEIPSAEKNPGEAPE